MELSPIVYAFLLTAIAGLCTGIGSVLFIRYIGDATFGLLFAAVAGIMVFISLDQLLPTAEKHGEHHLCTYGLLAGMALMALSLLLFLT